MNKNVISIYIKYIVLKNVLNNKLYLQLKFPLLVCVWEKKSGTVSARLLLHDVFEPNQWTLPVNLT